MGSVYQIRVELEGVRPEVWRRLLVSDATTLDRLHRVIQDAFGWTDSHLHEFEIRGVRYGDPRNDETGELNVEDEGTARLRKLGLKAGSRFGYLYDFGDSWEHSVEVERILPAEPGARLPLCVDGARACPPEDVGGADGYAQFLAAVADKAHPEHEDYLTWAGGSFDPEAFDRKAANRRIRLGGHLRREANWDLPPEPWVSGDAASDTAAFDATESHETAEDEAASRSLELRRDVVSLIEYLRDNKVTATASAGNLPLKAVSEIAARFVSPPALETRIGEYVDRCRSEEDVRPVFFARLLARGAGLLSGGPGRRWRLTTWGEMYLAASAFAQVLALLRGFWYRVDWALLQGRWGFGHLIEPSVRRVVLNLLRALPHGQPTTPEAFTDRLIEEARITWEETKFDVRSAARSAFESMVIRPLASLGVLATEVVEERGTFGVTKVLKSLSVTALGGALLKALA